jgi:hypothetical protein
MTPTDVGYISKQSALNDEVLDDDTRRRFLAQLVGTATGRQHILSRSVDAEEGDEGGVFDRLVELVDDPTLKQVVERHRDDEVRHAQLFRDCLDRLGLTKQVIPETLRLIPPNCRGDRGDQRYGPARPADQRRRRRHLCAALRHRATRRRAVSLDQRGLPCG